VGWRVRLGEGTGRQLLHADLTSADTRAQVAGLERVRLRALELGARLRVDRRQPEAELVGEVVARAACAVALDERRRAEVFQARAGTLERLTAAIGAGTGVLQVCTHTHTHTHTHNGQRSAMTIHCSQAKHA